MADEVESHRIEQLPLFLRCVVDKDNIREKFLEFGKCRQTNEEAIFTEITRILKKCEIDVNLCRGQIYDEASNLSSENVRVQNRIKHFSKKAVFMHVYSHNLSFVVWSACNVPKMQKVWILSVKNFSGLFVKVGISTQAFILFLLNWFNVLLNSCV